MDYTLRNLAHGKLGATRADLQLQAMISDADLQLEKHDGSMTKDVS